MMFAETMRAMKAAHAGANVFESMRIADNMDALAMAHAGIAPWVAPTYEELAAKACADARLRELAVSRANIAALAPELERKALQYAKRKAAEQRRFK